jgi:hypothetical protein
MLAGTWICIYSVGVSSSEENVEVVAQILQKQLKQLIGLYVHCICSIRCGNCYKRLVVATTKNWFQSGILNCSLLLVWNSIPKMDLTHTLGLLTFSTL